MPGADRQRGGPPSGAYKRKRQSGVSVKNFVSGVNYDIILNYKYIPKEIHNNGERIADG